MMQEIRSNARLLFAFNLLGFLVAATIPFHNLVNSYLISAYVLLFLLNIIAKNFTVKPDKHKFFFLFISFFIFEAISYFWSENKQEAAFILSKKTSLLVFPLIFAFVNEIDFKMIFRGFILGCIAASVYCLGYAAFSIIASGNKELFEFESFSGIIGTHHVYLTLHFAFALFILMNKYETLSGPTTQRAVILGFSGILFLCIVILSARTLMVVVTIILLWKIFFGTLKGRTYVFRISFLIFMLAAGLTVVWFSSSLKSKITDIINTKFYFNPDENNANGFTLRLVKWQCSIEALKENPIMGVGIGDGQNYLQKCYAQKNFWGQVFRYNSHNQYLQTALYAGVFSLIFYVAALLFPLVNSFKKGYSLYIIFLILIISTGLTESFLERQHGVVFYSFFNSLFAFHVLKGKRQFPLLL